MRNSPEAWDALIAKYGPEFTIMGAEPAGFWESGENDWKHVIRPNLEPLGDAPRLLEWGAGIGRVSKAGIADVGADVWWAFEPSAVARREWLENASGETAILFGTEDIASAWPAAGFTHAFCWFTMHNIAYDDVWEFFGFCGEHLAPNGILLFDYIDIASPLAPGFMERKDGSEWPSYMWSPEQLGYMLQHQCPDIDQVRVVDRPRRLEVWRRPE